MAINDISLTSGMRNNLLSLQNTTTLINRTQTRLSTGKKVNTALDNPTNFFAAQTATARATDLSNRKDGMSEAVQMVSAANAGISGITSLIESAQGVVQAALATTSTTDRASYATTFDTLLTQITELASDSGYRGTNFLNGTNQTVEFAPTTGGATLQIQGFDATATGLGISTTTNASVVTNVYADTSNITESIIGQGIYGQPNQYSTAIFNDENANPQNYKLVSATGVALADGGAKALDFHGTLLSGSFTSGQSVTMMYSASGYNQTTGAANGPEVAIPTSTTTVPGGNLWASTSGIQSSATQLEGALTTLRNESSKLSANLSVVTARQNFTDNMVSTLQTGADNLTLADTNQEGANLLMLQTRQSLGITSLSLASQAAQAVLKLF